MATGEEALAVLRAQPDVRFGAIETQFFCRVGSRRVLVRLYDEGPTVPDRYQVTLILTKGNAHFHGPHVASLAEAFRQAPWEMVAEA